MEQFWHVGGLYTEVKINLEFKRIITSHHESIFLTHKHLIYLLIHWGGGTSGSTSKKQLLVKNSDDQCNFTCNANGIVENNLQVMENFNIKMVGK